MICSSFLSLSLGCEHQHLLPSSRLPTSIPIHTVILSLQPTLSSGSFSLKNKLVIQTPTCFSKYCTLTCKVPPSASPSFLSCPYSYHLGCYSSVPPISPWTVIHKVPWRMLFFPLAFSNLNLFKCPISLCPWALSLLPLHLI